MDRREFVHGSALSLAGASSLSALAAWPPRPRRRSTAGRAGGSGIGVAFVISEGANVIDLAGPWEVFQDVMVREGGHRHPFDLYTVSDRTEPVEATGGLAIVPDHELGDAPPPAVVSVGAQRGSPEIHRWLREQHGRPDVLTMSVCTGAFQLGRAGILEGRRATTHHDFWDSFEEQFPRTTLVRGRRFVDDGDVVTAGGLTSGIDAALHVVSRLVGSEAAARTADYMEYEGEGWRGGTGRRGTGS